MLQRPLGRTGLTVSQLGFGAMRLPMVGEGTSARIDRERAIPMLHAAFLGGVNYVDTAIGYCNSDSQCAVGEALRGWRERVILSTKNHYYGDDERTWWTLLEQSLQRLDVGYIDIYHHHGITWQAYEKHVRPTMSHWMRKAKEQKLIRHIATSFHDNGEALRKIVDEGYVEVVTLQYNMLDRSLEDAIAYAHERGVGIVVMGPVGGGRLGCDSEILGALLPSVRRVPELALRFVLANPNISVALSGMSEMQHVWENIAIASDARGLSAEELAVIHEHLDRLSNLADLYCTGCGYCKPCPNGVDIPAVFAIFNLANVWRLDALARERYAALLQRGLAADKCIRCGECEAKCPQKIGIPEQLEKAHEQLTKKEK